MRSMTTAFVWVIAVAALVGCERYKLDRQMDELCKKDGGARIYKKVQLLPEMFNSAGNVKTSAMKKDGDYILVIANEYVMRGDVTILKEGDPLKGNGRLSRVHSRVTRIDDGELLAEGTEYLRAGGDLLVIGHHTQASCPDVPVDLVKEVFVRE